MKLGDHKHSKVTEPYFSRMKKGPKMAPKWTVSIIFQNGLKVKVIFFLIFCMKLMVHKGSKVTDGINITQRGLK